MLTNINFKMCTNVYLQVTLSHPWLSAISESCCRFFKIFNWGTSRPTTSTPVMVNRLLTKSFFRGLTDPLIPGPEVHA